MKTKAVRHVGLTESVSMLADALGFKVDRITDEIQPKIATETIKSEFLTVEPGQVCGLVQDGVGYRKGEPVIALHMEAYLGAPETYDEVASRAPRALRVRCRRLSRRHRDRVDRGQLAAEGDRRRARAAHDARPADPVVLQRPLAAGRSRAIPGAGPSWPGPLRRRRRMDAKQSAHLARVRHLRERFRRRRTSASSRALRGAADEAVERVPAGGWSVAQIAWHVATVTNRFAALISGEGPAPSRCPTVSSSGRGRRCSRRFRRS